MTEESRISMASGCNAEGKPFVHYIWDSSQKKCQWTPEEAKQHALCLLQCAEAAEHDASVFGLLTKEMEFNKEDAARFIGNLRNHRRND